MNELKRLLNSVCAAGWIIYYYFPFMGVSNKLLSVCIPAAILIFTLINRHKNYARYIFLAFGGLVIGYFFAFCILYRYVKGFIVGITIEEVIGIPSLILIIYVFEVYRTRVKPEDKSTLSTNYKENIDGIIIYGVSGSGGGGSVSPTFSSSYPNTLRDYGRSSDSTTTDSFAAWRAEEDARIAKDRSDREAKSQKIRKLEALQAYYNFLNSNSSSDLLNHETRCIQDELRELRDW